MNLRSVNERKALTRVSLFALRLTVLAVLLFNAGCDHDSETKIIRAISMLPRQTDYTRDFERWIDRLNEHSDGKFHVVFVGGPEAIPTFEQADAVRTGVVHMVFGPATYYMGLLPEVEAMFASNLSPMETRANGGLALMDRIHREKLGARYLARALYIEFHIFTRERPALDEHGVPDLTNKLVRGGPVWRDFISGLGANFASVAAPDVYMALERNMIQGVGWPIIGLTNASWHQHLNYRIDPGVFSSDVGIIFNSEYWSDLPGEVRAVLNEAVVEYEQGSYQRFRTLTGELDAELRELGMQVLQLDEEGERRYRQLARNVIWDRLKKRSPAWYDELKSRFYVEDTGAAGDG